MLPAGDYKVSAEDGLARQEQTVKIAAGDRDDVRRHAGDGPARALGSARQRQRPGRRLGTDGVTFIVYEDDPDAPQGRREVTRSAAPSPAFTLPAGTYYVTARTGGSELKEQIAIGAGDAVQEDVRASTLHT